MKASTKQLVLDNLDSIAIGLDEDETFPSNPPDRAFQIISYALTRMAERIVPSVETAVAKRSRVRKSNANIKITKRRNK